jgi:hypothetical protein
MSTKEPKSVAFYTGAGTQPYALGVVFVGAATYAGRQSALHRSQERQARGRELAIGALGSFLADVAPTEVQALKLGVAAGLFVDHELDFGTAGYQSPFAQVVDVARRTLSRDEKPSGG